MAKDEALPFGVGGGLVAIKTLLSRDPCVHANTAIEMIDAILKEHPAAQPAPVQEPVAYLFTNVQSGDIESSTDPDYKEGEREMWFRERLVRPAAQRQWVGLTDEERNECTQSPFTADQHLAIEAKLKEKNT